ncbi:MAG TPA: 4-(cytidine 5'-diphospho)-2-C-methyl-D-erythritol kinase [Actinomycetota bacterium]|nr:4-(cytidine 5'-diphospho)-2-C-methyl-D-erythritol kinase [Actinomycetota bacterium]
MKGAVRIRTHAKINLFLRVVGGRADGYHEIETILHGVRLADDVTFVPTTTGRIELVVDAVDDVEPVPHDHTNLVWRAATALVERGVAHEGILIRLTKRIPVGAGLGGGSGNAAGALVVLNRLWNAGVDHGTLLALAGAVGSDVPYCIGGGTALATGRGEQLTVLPAPEPMWFVLGVWRRPLSTADVYQGWDAFGVPTDTAASPMAIALGSGDVADVATLVHNDLEQVAFELRPEIEAGKRALLDAGALGACMSGSGPTVFGIARGRDDAHVVAGRVEDVFDRVFVVPSQSQCVEELD